MPLDKIKQTSKLLLIDRFTNNPEDPRSLPAVLRTEDRTRKQHFFNTIKSELEVKSFQEFVSRFKPTVWEWMTAENGEPKFHFSLEEPSWIPPEHRHEIEIDTHEFYKMVISLYEKRSVSSDPLLDFDYSEVARLLSPKRVSDNIKAIRRDLSVNYEKLQRAKQQGMTVSQKRLESKIKKQLKEATAQYAEDPLAMMQLAIVDTEQQLLHTDGTQKGSGQSGMSSGSAILCRLSYDDEGRLDVQMLEPTEGRRPIPSSSETLQIEDGNQSEATNELVGWVEEAFDEGYPAASDFERQLVVSAYSGEKPVASLDRKVLEENHKQYMKVYETAEQDFVTLVSACVEKLLDVRVLFDQIGKQPDEELEAPIVVANCLASELIDDPKTKEAFEWYIRENEQETTERIWFAIVPGIGDEDFMDDEDFDEELDDSDAVTRAGGLELANLNAFNQTMEILTQGRITTFFNFMANETTGFEGLSRNLIREYKKKLKTVEGNPYAVFCYPNFTVLPREAGSVWIGAENLDSARLELPGIYIDAAYVAAGLVIRSQIPSLLRDSGLSAKDGLPGVRFDFEEGDHRYRLLTTTAREGNNEWPREVVDTIGEDMFGFCFSGSQKVYNGEIVRNNFVDHARCMKKDSERRFYDPLYMQLTMDLVRVLLRMHGTATGGRFQTSTITNFINDYVTRQWGDDASRDYVNRICHPGESIDFVEDAGGQRGNLRVKFNGAEQMMPIDIVKDTSEQEGESY